MKIKTIATSIFLLPYYIVIAQPPAIDSTTYSQALAYAKNTYLAFMGAEAPIYNGPLHKHLNYNLSEGSQYFLPVQSPEATVVYNGIVYTNISLLFDVLNNKLIATNPENNKAFEVFTNQVSYFELGKHRFVNLQNSPSKKMPAAFYEIHFEGQKSGVYEIHQKTLNEELGEKYKRYEIEDNSIFYVKKDGEYYRVDKKKNLYQIYENHQTELKLFVKNNDINLSKINGENLIKIAAYFDTL